MHLMTNMLSFAQSISLRGPSRILGSAVFKISLFESRLDMSNESKWLMNSSYDGTGSKSACSLVNISFLG